MSVDPGNAIVPTRTALPQRGPATAWGVFCASPTVLEAINGVRHAQGMPTLLVLDDGTIGSPDPLMFRVEYVPNPFFVM